MSQNNFKPHSFHIPVMGLAFTIDSPIKIAKYGISSVVSIVDDHLIERMNKHYSNLFKLSYQEITTKVEDYRAKRITAYLNTVDTITKQTFESLKNSYHDAKGEFEKYMEMLPDFSALKKDFQKVVKTNSEEVSSWIDKNLKIGSIDVNIMTKLDKVNYLKGEQLPNEYNDAHAALRGFANSKLSSSVVLSAGMNPRLYAYFENFTDFFPTKNDVLKKKIVLKVSDYRSAIIQGKFLAKKGLWVSEYRVESGLNCGGHAFATDGFLLGPILEEFKNNKTQLVDDVHQIYAAALGNKEKHIPKIPLNISITVQGGVGNFEEHSFLLNNYNVDSVGWGTPFLLVPEATTVDKPTIETLKKATEKDLYLSGVSPLGVPFNSLRGSSNDFIRKSRIENGKPGSSCPKKFLVSNKEYSSKAICTASRKYQTAKIDELKKEELHQKEYDKKYFKITEKTCLCDGLSNAASINYAIEKKAEEQGVAICPGPNMAYYSEEISLQKMVAHIYGKTNVISHKERPNMFIKELKMYVDYFFSKVDESKEEMTKKQEKYLNAFYTNLNDGIAYYEGLFSKFENNRDHLLHQLANYKLEIEKGFIKPVLVPVK